MHVNIGKFCKPFIIIFFLIISFTGVLFFRVGELLMRTWHPGNRLASKRDAHLPAAWRGRVQIFQNDRPRASTASNVWYGGPSAVLKPAIEVACCAYRSSIIKNSSNEIERFRGTGLYALSFDQLHKRTCEFVSWGGYKKTLALHPGLFSARIWSPQSRMRSSLSLQNLHASRRTFKQILTSQAGWL